MRTGSVPLSFGTAFVEESLADLELRSAFGALTGGDTLGVFFMTSCGTISYENEAKHRSGEDCSEAMTEVFSAIDFGQG